MIKINRNELLLRYKQKVEAQNYKETVNKRGKNMNKISLENRAN